MNIGIQAGGKWGTLSIALLALTCVCLGIHRANAQREPARDPSVFGLFAGSSPSGEAIQRLLQIPSDAASDLIEWNLTLFS